MHTAAVACLFCVMSRHRALPLRCDSLPLVVHAAAQRAYAMHASQQGAAAQQWTADDAALVRRVQGVLEEMLGWVRQEAAHAGPAGAAARAMWQLWEQHAPPAPAAAAGGAGGPAAKGGGIILGAAAAEWDRASSAAAALSGASLVRTAESGARLPYAAPPALNGEAARLPGLVLLHGAQQHTAVPAPLPHPPPLLPCPPAAGAHGYSALEAAQLRAAYEAGLMGEPFLGDEEEAYGAGSYDSMDEYGEDYLDYEDPFYESYGGYW